MCCKFSANFNPRPPRGGRQIDAFRFSCCYVISIHALREEGDCGNTGNNSWAKLFQSTPSARRATLRQAVAVQHYYISIHALREEGDSLPTSMALREGIFQSTPSARRATWYNAAQAWSQIFQSTPSARRATHRCSPKPPQKRISIHALREEGDGPRGVGQRAGVHFNPRPPRGGRRDQNDPEMVAILFQSTPSARRATRL